MISRRGLFGLALGAGASAVAVRAEPLVAKHEPTETAKPVDAVDDMPTVFPQEYYEQTKLKWFNRGRKFGMLEGLVSGHQILIHHSVFDKAGAADQINHSMRYWVFWRRMARGPVAQEIHAFRRWTLEEAEAAVRAWRDEQEL